MKRRQFAAKIGMMTMAGKAFVDTNILLRALFTDMDSHVKADALLKTMIREDTELWISGQVIREFIVQATHPNTLKTPLTMQAIIEEVNQFLPLFQVADETAAVRAKWLALVIEYPTKGKQVHDANMVATMLVNGIDTLLTMNLSDLKWFVDEIKLIGIDESP